MHSVNISRGTLKDQFTVFNRQVSIRRVKIILTNSFIFVFLLTVVPCWIGIEVLQLKQGNLSFFQLNVMNLED